MTKIEHNKCTRLMYDAIRLARQAKEEYKNADTSDIEMRKADQHYGEALGMNQVLAVIGFKHKDMEILGRLI